MARTIRVAHSPDSDDAFMFYALAAGKIDTGDLIFEHELQDIETLNRRALAGDLEVTAVSIHAFAYLSARYALLPHGASMGEGYGPRLVARKRLRKKDLSGARVAIPGKMTSAFLALQMYVPDVDPVVVPFDEIIDYVAEGKADAGLIIHEGQLTFGDAGLKLLLDLGEWWGRQTKGLPLPLGGNVIRRDMGEELMVRVSRILRASIKYGLTHRRSALKHAMKYGRGLTKEQADEFVGMYVNKRTLDYGEDGRRALKVFLDRGFDEGLIPRRVRIEFVED